MQTRGKVIEKVVGKDRREEAFRIRREVFIVEQGIAPEEVYDKYDETAVHFLASIEAVPVGTTRLLIEGSQGRIGRMAVLKPYRGQGIGRALLEEVIKEARLREIIRLYLHAQAASIYFYRGSGFIPYGEPFLEAEIIHQAMEKRL